MEEGIMMEEVTFSTPPIESNSGLNITCQVISEEIQTIFECPDPNCHKKFNSSWSLTRHTRTHSGDKPYKCDREGCGKEFGEKCALRRHEQTHNKEKQWICSVPNCGKRFKLKEYLEVHKRTHLKRKKHDMHSPLTDLETCLITAKIHKECLNPATEISSLEGENVKVIQKRHKESDEYEFQRGIFNSDIAVASVPDDSLFNTHDTKTTTVTTTASSSITNTHNIPITNRDGDSGSLCTTADTDSSQQGSVSSPERSAGHAPEAGRYHFSETFVCDAPGPAPIGSPIKPEMSLPMMNQTHAPLTLPPDMNSNDQNELKDHEDEVLEQSLRQATCSLMMAMNVLMASQRPSRISSGRIPSVVTDLLSNISRLNEYLNDHDAALRTSSSSTTTATTTAASETTVMNRDAIEAYHHAHRNTFERCLMEDASSRFFHLDGNRDPSPFHPYYPSSQIPSSIQAHLQNSHLRTHSFPHALSSHTLPQVYPQFLATGTGSEPEGLGPIVHMQECPPLLHSEILTVRGPIPEHFSRSNSRGAMIPHDGHHHSSFRYTQRTSYRDEVCPDHASRHHHHYHQPMEMNVNASNILPRGRTVTGRDLGLFAPSLTAFSGGPVDPSNFPWNIQQQKQLRQQQPPGPSSLYYSHSH